MSVKCCSLAKFKREGTRVVQCQFIFKNIASKHRSFPRRIWGHAGPQTPPPLPAPRPKPLTHFHHVKIRNLRSAGLRGGRLTEAGARRPGTWTSAPWGAAAAACCRVSRAEEACAARQSWRQSSNQQRVSEWAEQSSTSEENQLWSRSWGCFFGGIGGGVPGVSATPASLSLSSEE